jgi:hypothetical protein
MQSSNQSSKRPSYSEALERLKAARLGSPEDIRRRFENKPISFLQFIDPHIRFPKKLRLIFALIWLRQDQNGKPATRFIIKGPRGGGKSVMLGALGFVQWFLQAQSIVDMGGSLMQAQGVYNYFVGHIYTQQSIVSALPSDPTMKETKSDKGNYFKAVAASPKAVRGPHPDKLYIDEACETKDELILDAMPMVNTSAHSQVVMTSTFHKIFGYFQETWDRADELGWVRLSWDSFDVARQFDPAIWRDETLNREIPDLALLEKRAAGRTGDPEGWIPVENLIQAWREKTSADYFDVEYMGSRPSTEGMVNDPEDIDACTIDEFGEYAYVPGTHTAGGLDWGFSGQTSWVVGMAHKDRVIVQLENRIYTEVRSGPIIEDIVKDVLKYRIRKIHADHSHQFENKDLRAAINEAIAELSPEQQFRCTLIEVPFGRPYQVAKKEKTGGKKQINKHLGTEKDVMLGNYRAYWSRHLYRIMRTCVVGIWQHKRYRYQKGSDKPEKKDDHVPDSTMLMLREWMLGEHAQSMPVDLEKRTTSPTTGGLMNMQF